MLRVYTVLGILQSFYIDRIRECVGVEVDGRERFPVNVGLRQGCVMSP